MSAMNIEDTSGSEQSISSHKSLSKKDRNRPTCRLCAKHNLKILSQDHKRYCLGQLCMCKDCDEVRKEQSSSAVETKRTRNKQQDTKRKILLQTGDLPRPSLVDPAKPIKHFIISEEKKYLDICQTNEELIHFKRHVIIKDEVIIEAKRQECKKRKGKKRKANGEEIIELKDTPDSQTTSTNHSENPQFQSQSQGFDALYNLKDLLHYTLYHCLVCNVYDVCHTNNISALVDEIVASIYEYVYHSSNSNENTESNLYLLEGAKKRIFSPSIIRHLKIIWQTITLNVISSFVIVHLTYYQFPFIYYLFPP
ncbi:uncharacterized protein [Anoplolepis gracilipes]|uniref:uncharacterized protein isoform X2 n=1 Tax=Anoplolepis gracilipes TaxID=354296 RepID=UPI003BA09498